MYQVVDLTQEPQQCTGEVVDVTSSTSSPNKPSTRKHNTLTRVSLALLAVSAVAFVAVANTSSPGVSIESQFVSSSTAPRTSDSKLFEYIPDGLSKAQWKAIKAKEQKEKEDRANGVLGATRFKSRSFEAWQKSGGKHLFPVDPNTTPYEERPYMQRKNGDWGGSDLEKKGLLGRGQGAASKKNFFDEFYEKQKKSGALDSESILGKGPGLPWTGKKLNEQFGVKARKEERAGGVVAAKGRLSKSELAARKKRLAKVVDTSSSEKEKPARKGGFFG